MYIKLKKLKIHIICFLLIIIFTSINFSLHMIFLVLSISIHEIGHIVFIRHYGLTIKSIEILPLGINIRTNNKLLSYKSDILILFAGPIFNLVVAFILTLVIRFAFFSEYLMFFLISNLIYAGINLFPVKSLDGGRICEILLKCFLSEHTAYYIFMVISGIFLAVLSFIAFLILMVTGYNFTLILLCCYLFYTIHFSPKNGI